jgi:hypothetical protein
MIVALASWLIRLRGCWRISLDDFQLADSRPCESVFPLVPDAKQLLGVLRVNLVDVRRVRVLVLFDEDWMADDDVDGSAIGHEADVVVEDTCGSLLATSGRDNGRGE